MYSDAKFKIFVIMPRNYFLDSERIQSSTGPHLIIPQPATDQILWTAVADKQEINKFSVQKLIYSFYSVMDQNLVYKIDLKIYFFVKLAYKYIMKCM